MDRNQYPSSPDEAAGVNPTEAFVVQMDAALASLPLSRRTAFETALRIAHTVVQSESPLRFFLQRESGNIFAAAARLALYWEYRLHAMGSSLGCQPLRVLRDSSDALLSSLKPMGSDSSGRAVFFWDRPPHRTLSSQDLMRCLFVWNDLVMCESTVREGVVGVSIVEPGTEHLSLEPVLDVFTEALPVRVHALHLCLVGTATDYGLALRQRLAKYQIAVYVHGLENASQSLAVHGITWFRQDVATAADITVSTAPASANNSLNGFSAFLATTAGTQSSYSSTIVPIINPSLFYSQLPADAQGFASHQESPYMQREGLRRLDEAMELIPLSLKAAYLSALSNVPYLVQIESSPLRYLRWAKYDAWAAAHRLAKYWKHRSELFGSKAFLPLTISGKGALDEEDIQGIVSGYFSVLPNDHSNRPVLLYDAERRRDDSRQTRFRVGFYILSIISAHDECQTWGFQVIMPLGRTPAVGTKLDTKMTEFVDYVLGVVPTFVSQLHLVQCPKGVGQRLFYEFVLPLAIRMIGGAPAERAVVHVGEKPDLVRKLAAYGMPPTSIPDCVGGVCTYDEHIQLIQGRYQIEQELYMQCFAPDGATPSAATRHILQSLVPGQQVTKQQQALGQLKSAFDAEDRNQVPLPRIETQDSHALEQCIEGIQPCIVSMPSDRRQAYDQALASCPDLVLKETDLLSFALVEGCNAQATAERLVDYWTTRKEIFGERAFLPLHQTGDGALNKRDTAILESFYLMSLPCDGADHPVLFCDGSRLKRSPSESRLRCLFYMCSVLAEERKAQTHGIVVIHVQSDPSFDRLHKESIDVVQSSVPFKIWDVHILQRPSARDERGGDTFIVDHFRKIVKNQVLVHSFDSADTLVEKLSRYGLSPDNLPVSCGGTFDFEKLVEWQELRIRYEWNVPPPSSARKPLPFDFSGVPVFGDLDESQQLDRRRKLNVLHSRRKRERDRVELEVLSEQVEAESARHGVLEVENRRLEGLLTTARGVVSECGW